MFAIFWIGYALPAVLLRIPYVQQRASEVATSELSRYLGVPVRVGHIDVEWLNHVLLKDLYLEDEEGRILFQANRLSAGFEWWPMLERKLVITNVRLFSFQFNLSKRTPQDPLNLQFLIDAFSKKDTTRKNPNIDLQINSILLRKGAFRFDIGNAPETPGRFNPKHLSIQDLSATISLGALRKDSIDASIKKMSFTEQSGLQLERLSLQVVGNPDSVCLHQVEVKLPATTVRIPEAQVAPIAFDNLKSVRDSSQLLLEIAPSRICLKDVAPLVPAFRNFSDTLDLSADASGRVNDIALHHLTLKYSDKMLFVGEMNLRNVLQPKEGYVMGKVNKMYVTNDGLTDLLSNFGEKPVQLPAPLRRLGTLSFTGEISGAFDQLVASGKLGSAVGSLEAEVQLDKQQQAGGVVSLIKGQLKTSALQLHELFPAGNPYGQARLDLEVDARLAQRGAFTGEVTAHVHEFDFKGYKYEEVRFDGLLTPHSFSGDVSIDDPNISLSATGFFQHLGAQSQFDFAAELNRCRLDSLHLSKKYQEPDLSFALDANFRGNSIDNIEGRICLDRFKFTTATDTCRLDALELNALGHSEERRLTIESDLVNGRIEGAYSFRTLVPSLIQTMQQYVPALIRFAPKQPIEENNFQLLLTVENTEAFSRAFRLPFTMVSTGRITGQYDNRLDKFRFEAWLPKFQVGKSLFESGYLSCGNPADQVNLEVRAINYNLLGRRNYLNLKAEAKEDVLQTFVSWANNKERLFKADLMAKAQFQAEEDEAGKRFLHTHVDLQPSELVFNDSVWRVSPATIDVQQGQVAIQNFRVAHDQQYAYIRGMVSPDPSDTLFLDLNQIELAYIFDIIGNPVLQFAGKATGKFNLVDLYNSRIMNTDLEVQDFSFNRVNLGRLSLFSEWDNEEQGILMLGSIYQNDSTWSDVNGYIYPVGPQAGLSLHFDAKEVDVAFINPFVEKVIKNLKGRGTGQVSLYGPFKDLNVAGDAYVKDGGLGVEFTNTYYTFSDSVHMDSTSVQVRQVELKDKFGNTGQVDLRFNHKHFRDYDFDVHVATDRVLVYDVPQKQNPLIFGTVFGSGTARVRGNEQMIHFDINMQSAPNTNVYLDFLNNNSAEEYNFITFVDKKKQAKEAETQTGEGAVPVPAPAVSEGAEMRMNFLLDITPDAQIELIMDPVAGDRIKGTANGNLQVQYGTKTDLRMYGTVGIIEGKYNFSLQQVIRKDFKIRDGSTIRFNGDPFNADMNIDAIYSLTANLSDLDRSVALESPRQSVPVNCVLQLDGLLRSPTITFDMELPNSNEELERQVKSLVDTEDMMSRQIVYLLVLNKFYTPNYTDGYRGNEWNAVASSAISQQLSSLLGSLTDKVQIGANIRADRNELSNQTEMEMLLSSQLFDNRLLINGNFGYRNSIYTNQKNVFVGEFDLEYKLTRSGEISLKAYNHSNDNNLYQYMKQSMTTQGVGIKFQKEFNHLSELFRRRRLLLPTVRGDSIPASQPE